MVAATRKAGQPVCIMVADAGEAQAWRAPGASAFIVASDQGFLRQAAARTRAEFSALTRRQASRARAGRLPRAAASRRP
jgi:2-keto-3-deoxy-L-rhamnonate aldolase RhmA